VGKFAAVESTAPVDFSPHCGPGYVSVHPLSYPGDDIETWMEDARRMYD
jgi:hypothetical protein